MNCIYESQNKDICKLVNFLPSPCVSFLGLPLDPMDCISLGYFFANKQLDKVCTVELGCSSDIEVEVLMKELSQGCMLKETMGVRLFVRLFFTACEYSYHGFKCISEAVSQTLIVRGLVFTDWNHSAFDATTPLTCLIEGLCRRPTKNFEVGLLNCVSCKYTYHLTLLLAFGNLHELWLSFNNISKSLTMSLLAQALKYNRTLTYGCV